MNDLLTLHLLTLPLGLAISTVALAVLFRLAVDIYFKAKEHFVDRLIQKNVRRKDTDG